MDRPLFPKDVRRWTAARDSWLETLNTFRTSPLGDAEREQLVRHAVVHILRCSRKIAFYSGGPFREFEIFADEFATIEEK